MRAIVNLPGRRMGDIHASHYDPTRGCIHAKGLFQVICVLQIELPNQPSLRVRCIATIQKTFVVEIELGRADESSPEL